MRGESGTATGRPDGFYQRLLTQCWREAHRILKPGGILAFTFHHSEDEPWVAVLESLFDAGFYLQATYPIRSDETKGEGAKPGTFGSQKIEYDIVHVCRKRVDEPQPVSWARMRREVQEDVRQLQAVLEHHAKEGLAAADLQVIKRGKALEYFSRHYGKVLVDQERALTVKEAVVGIIQLLDEETGKVEPPPVEAEPFMRQFLRIFNGRSEEARDRLQKYLRGTGVSPEEFEQRGWCKEEKKVYKVTSPLDFARSWVGKHRRNLTSDYDQAMLLIGACFDGSGINASDTLMSAWQNLTGTIFAVTIGVVAVFMVVGGIVIMNIMLASVTERTHEIGIRKSMGARQRDILWQFIIESGVMSGIGGIAGVVLAALIARVVNIFFTAAVPVSAVIVGVTLSSAVGLFFGIYPASKAARLDPVEALRMEN